MGWGWGDAHTQQCSVPIPGNSQDTVQSANGQTHADHMQGEHLIRSSISQAREFVF